jgi:Uma2 family endonuclease
MIVRYQPVPKAVPETVADLLRRLGDIPPERVRLKPAPGTATEADLERPELIDGTLVEKAMGSREGMLGGYIAHLFWLHVKTDDLGVVLGGDGEIRLKAGLVRKPDATFIPWASFPNEELPDEVFWSVAPGLIVEVLSPGNTKAEIDRKLVEFFAGKCKLAWVIDPKAKTAKVYTSATKTKQLDETGVLDGGKVLPGFKLPLADLFAVGKRRKKS